MTRKLEGFWWRQWKYKLIYSLNIKNEIWRQCLKGLIHQLIWLYLEIQGKKIKDRPSKIACTKNSCTVLISLCKNNLNLPMCSSFFSAMCLVASSFRLSCCNAHSLAALRWLFCLFLKKPILQPDHKTDIS